MALRVPTFPEVVNVPLGGWVTVDHRALAEDHVQQNSTILEVAYTPGPNWDELPEFNRITGYTHSPTPGFAYRVAAGTFGITLEQAGKDVNGNPLVGALTVDVTTDEWGTKYVWLRDGRPIALTYVHVPTGAKYDSDNNALRGYIEVYGAGAPITTGQIRDLIIRRWPMFSAYGDSGQTDFYGDVDVVIDIEIDVQPGETLRWLYESGPGDFNQSPRRSSWAVRGGGASATWLHPSPKSERDTLSTHHFFIPS